MHKITSSNHLRHALFWELVGQWRPVSLEKCIELLKGNTGPSSICPGSVLHMDNERCSHARRCHPGRTKMGGGPGR